MTGVKGAEDTIFITILAELAWSSSIGLANSQGAWSFLLHRMIRIPNPSIHNDYIVPPNMNPSPMNSLIS